MECPHCGNDHPEGAGFCPTTGRPLPEGVSCPHCGQMHPSGAQFCPVTGQEIIRTEEAPKLKGRLWVWMGLVLLVGCTITMAGVWFGYNAVFGRSLSVPFLGAKESPTPLPEVTEEGLTPQPTALPTVTPTSHLTITVSPEPTETVIVPTSTEEVLYQINDIDGARLLFIPSGEFTMGSDPEKDLYFWGAESPSHVVSVNSFYIYETEVTNEMYEACVQQKACPRPETNNSRTIREYFGNPSYSKYPVIMVSWVHAVSYCTWAGGRLPTEAEWEKAARGTDGRLFPWGNDPYVENSVNLCDRYCPGGEKEESVNDGYPDTAPVGSFPDGASPFGALDMAGNVWEWVNDYFVPEYYKSSPTDNPLGPASGTRRGIRGGSWFNALDGVRTVTRASLPPDSTMESVGFRCVIDIP